MTTVRDIMTKEVVSVAADDSVASAADMLTVLAISGVPVRDKRDCARMLAWVEQALGKAPARPAS